jgi:hypothetical protein
MRQEWEPINWATKTRRNFDWDDIPNTRLRGLTLLLQGMLLLAVWAASTLLVWGIEPASFGPERLPRRLLWAGVTGVVLMLAGASMGITGVAIDKITVPSRLNPERWNRLLFQISFSVVLLLAIWMYLWFF